MCWCMKLKRQEINGRGKSCNVDGIGQENILIQEEKAMHYARSVLHFAWRYSFLATTQRYQSS